MDPRCWRMELAGTHLELEGTLQGLGNGPQMLVDGLLVLEDVPQELVGASEEVQVAQREHAQWGA